MFSSCVRGGKAYAAEQKIREFKKLLFRSKRLHKTTSTKRFDSRKQICIAVKNMNSINSQKYSYAPNAIEEKAVENEKLGEVYNFYRLVKVKEHAERYEHADINKGKKIKEKTERTTQSWRKSVSVDRVLKKERCAR